MRYRVVVKFMNSQEPGFRGFGRGIVQILEGVDEYGSLNRIAKEMGMAYSKAWRVLNECEEEFGVTLTVRDGARGSSLTDDARVLISRYHEMLDAADTAAKKVFDKYYG